jgi:hypothetical protein
MELCFLNSSLSEIQAQCLESLFASTFLQEQKQGVLGSLLTRLSSFLAWRGGEGRGLTSKPRGGEKSLPQSNYFSRTLLMKVHK